MANMADIKTPLCALQPTPAIPHTASRSGAGTRGGARARDRAPARSARPANPRLPPASLPALAARGPRPPRPGRRTGPPRAGTAGRRDAQVSEPTSRCSAPFRAHAVSRPRPPIAAS
ncbi:translation initiation factor IF-2-like [Elephas maximus indicus]|uniref:translation initiation factor IF-2-like n=1 Tax=Elephas maximus indicus TaxID=99487 RepID=UPI002116D177|nr:translation initiation factor IF-2-like [Elephas maximus indicus]